MAKKYKALLLLIGGLTLLSCITLASPQLPDYIIFKKDTIPTYNLLVEEYLQEHEKKDSLKLFGMSFRGGGSTSCWRGYQAIYKIDNDSLFLVDIIDCGERRNDKIDKDASAKRMEAIFKEKLVNGRVYINWYSGILNFPLNKKILRWDGIFYTTYEKETIVNIAGGRILKVREVENYVDIPGAIDRRYNHKVSDTLFKALEKVKWKKADDCDCSEEYLVTINEKGNVSKVSMKGYTTNKEIDEYWDRKEYNYCINTMIEVLRKLKFDIIKDQGKPVSEDIYIEIRINKNGIIQNRTN